MTLFVDTQHRLGHSGDVAPALRRRIIPASTVVETYLEYGDVALVGNGPRGRAIRVGIEIKRVADVLTCIQDGRFAGRGGQLEGMQRDYDLCWLLIQEDLRPDPSTGVLMRWLADVTGNGRRTGRSARTRTSTPRTAPRSSGRWIHALFGAKRAAKYGDLTNWLTSVQISSLEMCERPLFVWRTSSTDETAQWLVSQYHFWNDKKFEQHKSTHTFNTSLWDKQQAQGRKRAVGFVNEKTARRAAVLAQFDGIGYERAMNLAEKFRSTYAAMNASVSELVTAASVRRGERCADGLSRKGAEKLYEQIREEER